MPFDAFTAAAICDELRQRVIGSRIDKILQTSALGLALRVWSPGWAGSIVMSADARWARVYTTEAKLSKGLETPPPFLMLLRKYCTGARITGVTQLHLDRVICLSVSRADEEEVTLVAEVMGNRSNLILVGSDGSILGAIKLIGPRQSRTRVIRPHVRYEPPPGQVRLAAFGDGQKLDPLATQDETKIQAALGQVPSELRLADALVGLLRGCSPTLARDIEARVSEHLKPQGILQAIREQYDLLRTNKWSPVVVRRDRIPVDYKAYSDPPAANAEAVESISRAIELVSEGLESTDALKAGRQRVESLVTGRRVEVSSRLASLRRGLDAARDAESLLEAGNMILGFQHQIGANQSLLDVPEAEVRVSLDPALGPIDNAELYFKRYRKSRRAASRLPQLLAQSEADNLFLDDLSAYIDLAETPADLKRVESEYLLRFPPRKVTKESAKSRPASVGSILALKLPGDASILIGRSARQNEEITFKRAGRGDLWLHVKGFPGAHVILHGQDVRHEAAEQDERVRLAAAAAAYYSKARSERASDVIVARIRDVRRIPGGAPGQVTARNERIMRVAPMSAAQIEQATRMLNVAKPQP